MKNNDNGFFSRPWVMRVTSLILALFMFFYVNGSFLRQTTRQGNESALMSDKSQTIKVPLQVSIDSKRYVVTGYPQYVKIKLTGPSALVTTTVNTQNFKVYADLSSLGVGQHQVKLKVSGLNSELTSHIDPGTITVNIQAKETITAPVSVQLSSKTVTDGFEVGRAKPSMENVQVSGARSEVAKVAKVVAFVNVPHTATSTFGRQVTLQAVDKNGQTLNVVVTPDTLTVTVPITSTKSSSSTSSTASDGSVNESSTNGRDTQTSSATTSDQSSTGFSTQGGSSASQSAGNSTSK
ncbi:MAG: CdaR family protein [Limosilactobacillus gorillae]|jgi:YbbR domain-containing protein|uniref:CdaR family protein n=1 Tax=Limosilactobacillus gorillae TaxID=1450649 RepID=UPI000AAB70C5|nr:CdaR family protein [Limosilactobacillus gorillae]MDO4855810.1 CdaR family protein [Limosilactobacillus gorillae]